MRQLMITVVIALTVIAAAGCGSSPASSPGTGTPTPSCGSVVTHALSASTQVLSADARPLTCFAATARACKPAGLRVTEMGVDTGTTDDFVISSGGTPQSCPVTESSQWYTANFGGSQGPVTVTHCSISAVTSRGVTLTCAGQHILIPAAATSHPAA